MAIITKGDAESCLLIPAPAFVKFSRQRAMPAFPGIYIFHTGTAPFDTLSLHPGADSETKFTALWARNTNFVHTLLPYNNMANKGHKVDPASWYV